MQSNSWNDLQYSEFKEQIVINNDQNQNNETHDRERFDLGINS